MRLRGIAVRCGVAAERLLVERGRVVGVVANSIELRALGGVVLATGGFEGDAVLQRQFWSMTPVLSAAVRSNTGDGLRMAQKAGAGLWHMWHYHGSYGFRHPDSGYPFGVRLKRLPDWVPGTAPRDDVTMSWILLDRAGRRFMNEYEPYMQDTGHRPLEGLDFARLANSRIPAVLIVDTDGYTRYPLSAPTWHDAERGRPFRRGDAARLRRSDPAALRHSGGDIRGLRPGCRGACREVADWNALAAASAQIASVARRPGRLPIARPPFSGRMSGPIVSNTQGGPVHDEDQRVLDAFGVPIGSLRSRRDRQRIRRICTCPAAISRNASSAAGSPAATQPSRQENVA